MGPWRVDIDPRRVRGRAVARGGWVARMAQAWNGHEVEAAGGAETDGECGEKEERRQ